MVVHSYRHHRTLCVKITKLQQISQRLPNKNNTADTTHACIHGACMRTAVIRTNMQITSGLFCDQHLEK